MNSNYFNQDTNDWLEKRLGRFTASEIHKLFQSGRSKTQFFGAGAETYIRTKAAELLTMEVKEEIDFKQGEWGKANEGDACMLFEKETGLAGDYYGMANPTFFEYGEYAGCSPDWENNEVCADFKCPYNSAEHVKNLMLNSVEEFKDERWEYYCQLQMIMYTRKLVAAYFFSYDPRMVEVEYRTKLIKIYPDNVWVEEFKTRLDKAIEKVKQILEQLEIPKITWADYDKETQATILK